MLAIFHIYLDKVSHSNGIILAKLLEAYAIFDPIVNVMNLYLSRTFTLLNPYY
jgi:hypothetical protein